MLVYNSSTTSKRSLWPPEAQDLWVAEAYGSRLHLVGDTLSEWYDDWASALGANTLGYDAAYVSGFKPAASLPWQIEHDFAEQFCAAMGTEAVRFFKSGSDAVSCAVRLARGFTKKHGIIAFDKCYHGTGDWFGPGLWTKGGIWDDHTVSIKPFGEELKTDSTWSRDVAAIVVEPVPKAIELPPAGWLQHLREVCNEHQILLISDEIILGYRHALGGYLQAAGIEADLRCFGKAMGQGAAISACTGRRDVMEQLSKDVHFSGTNNGEPLPLMIAQWTLEQYKGKNICTTLNNDGSYLRAALLKAGFATRGLNSRFEVVFDNDEAKKSCIKYCFDNGILFPGFCSTAVSHTASQMSKLVQTLQAWKEGQ